MVQRKKIGLVYQNNELWIGGTYYIQNLVSALNTVADKHKPLLLIYTNSETEFQQIVQTGYPYLEFKKLEKQNIPLSIGKRIINKLLLKLTGYEKYPRMEKFDTTGVDLIFPGSVHYQIHPLTKQLFWIPDFQEIHHPQFFQAADLEFRKQEHGFMAASMTPIVFSSQNALKDFKQLFKRQTGPTYVMQFAVSHPELDDMNENELLAKFNLGKYYYIAPNQLWAHKNQKTVVEALRILKSNGKLNFQVAFTGKESDPRNPTYVSELKKMVKDFGLEEHVRFLGFIDRRDQLQLIKIAAGVIQPSLFEGWSTVVEDGKALRKMIVASDMAVHIEQLDDYPVKYFFSLAVGAESLAETIEALPVVKSSVSYDYDHKIKMFGSAFLDIIDKHL